MKAKQSGNPQFDFLLMDNWLNPYYKHVLKYISEGKYCPEIPKQEEEEEENEEKPGKAKSEEDNDDSDDDSDEEYELHPILQASFHKKIQKRQTASASPLPEPLGGKFSCTFAPITNHSPSAFPSDPADALSNAQFGDVDGTLDYSMWYAQGIVCVLSVTVMIVQQRSFCHVVLYLFMIQLILK